MALTAKSKVKINLIGFFLLGAGLIYAMATQVLSVLQSRYSVYAIFPDAGGVFTNQEVTYRGVTVGYVGDMEVVEDGVRIQLAIDDQVRIPREGTEARVMFKSAVGEQFVDLLPASDNPPYFEDGNTIPLDQTSIPVSTQELLSTVEAVLRGVPPKALKGVINALGEGLAGRGQDIGEIIESTAELAEVFARRSPEIESLLEQGTEVGASFLESRQDFARAIEELVTVSESLASSIPDLESLLRGTNETSDELVALIEQERPEVNQLIIDLGKINAIQARHGDDLKRLFRQLPAAVLGVAKTFEPDTGMIRFGLVQDQERHGCSYGTDRRRPEDRGDRPIPREGKCASDEAFLTALAQAARLPSTHDDAGASSPLPGVSMPEVSEPAFADGFGGRMPTLPHRMADWSWTLFYLNVM